MNEQMPGRSGATNMQIERLIVPKIKMTNISRISALHKQHSPIQFDIYASLKDVTVLAMNEGMNE